MGREKRFGVFQMQKTRTRQIWLSSIQKWSQEKNEKGNDGHLEWSEDSSKEEKEKEVANMCFMAINDLDEVNSNFSDEDMHDVFEELYEDFEKLSLKNDFS